MVSADTVPSGTFGIRNHVKVNGNDNRFDCLLASTTITATIIGYHAFCHQLKSAGAAALLFVREEPSRSGMTIVRVW
jgi:uncharacterized membrane protein YpjA